MIVLEKLDRHFEIILEKRSLVLRVSIHIYGVSEEIDGKTFIFLEKT